MEPGEQQLRKVFEDVTTNNVKTVIEYSTQTREMVRKNEEKVKHLEKIILEQNKKIAAMTSQLSIIQGKIYVDGT